MPNNCCKSFPRALLISSSSRMKRSSRLPHMLTCRKITSQWVQKRDTAATRLLRTRSTFSKSVMVSAAISKLGCSEMIFVLPGAKVDSAYYCNILLSQHMLPAIHQLAHVYDCTCSSRTACRPTAHVRQSIFCLRIHQTSSHQSCGCWAVLI